MNAYLDYSYNTGLTTKKNEIDEKIKKSKEQFAKGFVKGTTLSLKAYALYSLLTCAAYAADRNLSETPGKTSGNTGTAKPVIGPRKRLVRLKPGGRAKPTSSLVSKSGFKSLFSAILFGDATYESDHFHLDMTCTFLVFMASIIINRRKNW